MSTNSDARLSDHDLERQILGTLLLQPEAVDETRGRLTVADFHASASRAVYSAILAVVDRGSTPDLITVSDRLETDGTLDLAGGRAAIAGLTGDVVSSANLDYYLAQLRAYAVRREVTALAAQTRDDLAQAGMDAEEVLERLEAGVLDIRRQSGVEDQDVPATQALMEAADDIERRMRAKGEPTGVPSGFSALDGRTDGFQTEDLVIVGARPSVGKTAFALSMAVNQALVREIPVGFFSLEMSRRALMKRVISSEMRVDSGRLRAGMVRAADIGAITELGTRRGLNHLHIIDTPNMGLGALRSAARRLRARYGIRIVYIDYISLITPADLSIPRHEQVSQVSRSLKQLARELRIPVVALSQVKRESQGRAPTLADLRESGSLEQDADVVLFLHRDSDGENETADVLPTQCIVAKHRNGPTGTINLAFLPRLVRYEELEGGSY